MPRVLGLGFSALIAAAVVGGTLGTLSSLGDKVSEAAYAVEIEDPTPEDARRIKGSVLSIASPAPIRGYEGRRLNLWADFTDCKTQQPLLRPDGKRARAQWYVTPTEDPDQLDDFIWVASPLARNDPVFIQWRINRGSQAAFLGWATGPYIVARDGTLVPSTRKCQTMPKKAKPKK